MLMHAIAHGGCTNTLRESALKADFGRKIPHHIRDWNPHQYCAWLLSLTLLQLSYPDPAFTVTMMGVLVPRNRGGKDVIKTFCIVMSRAHSYF